MTEKDRIASVNITLLFREFLDYLVTIGYSDSVENLVEGVFQRAFFDEWTDYLAKRKLYGDTPLVNHIKDELMK